MEDFMKKFELMMVFCLICVNFMFSQDIDISQYEETTLFDYRLWCQNAPRGDVKRFKTTVLFEMQSGTTFYFRDLDNQSFTPIKIDRRWPIMERKQQVTVYFTVTNTYNGADANETKIDNIDYNNATQMKPWQSYIDDGRPGKKGWYFREIGDGRYEEVFFP
jgi:hypothetical protein